MCLVLLSYELESRCFPPISVSPRLPRAILLAHYSLSPDFLSTLASRVFDRSYSPSRLLRQLLESFPTLAHACVPHLATLSHTLWHVTSYSCRTCKTGISQRWYTPPPIWELDRKARAVSELRPRSPCSIPSSSELSPSSACAPRLAGHPVTDTRTSSSALSYLRLIPLPLESTSSRSSHPFGSLRPW